MISRLPASLYVFENRAESGYFVDNYDWIFRLRIVCLNSDGLWSMG